MTTLIEQDFDELSPEELDAIKAMEAACPPVEMVGRTEVIALPIRSQAARFIGVSLTDAIKAASQGN